MDIPKTETLKHIREVGFRLAVCAAELIRRLGFHDASKLEEPEASIFEEWTPKLRGITYGTPEYHSMLANMKPALDHHYAHNSHHPEFYSGGICEMDLLDLVEMICDWDAAAMRHADGDVFKSIELNQARFGYSDELKAVLRNTVTRLLKKPPAQ